MDKFHYFNGTGNYKDGNDFNAAAHEKLNGLANQGRAVLDQAHGLLPAEAAARAAAAAEAERLTNAEASQQSYNAGLDQANRTAATYAGVGALGAVGAGYGAYRMGRRR